MSATSQPRGYQGTATDARSSFGEILRAHRIAAGLTQESLAERAGLSVHGIQKLEQGVTHPYRDSARRLATALQLSGRDEAIFKSAAQPLPRVRRAPVLLPVISKLQAQHNLSLPITSFIDEAGQTAAVMDRLRANRLVTITGPGGCGKTRLAVEAGLQLVDDFADGVWFVDLAQVSDGSDVSEAITTALRVVRPSTQSTLDALTQYLQARQTLLILDNCEHVVDACARVADILLKACADVRLLATSRELLQIGGEATWRVASLSVVNQESYAEDDRDVTVDDVLASEAGRLLVDRARLLLASFNLTPQNAGAVAQICRRLDGIPLALELAAARLTTLSVEHGEVDGGCGHSA
jgi:transcriptional regulator with XRE-family HTH domain